MQALLAGALAVGVGAIAFASPCVAAPAARSQATTAIIGDAAGIAPSSHLRLSGSTRANGGPAAIKVEPGSFEVTGPKGQTFSVEASQELQLDGEHGGHIQTPLSMGRSSHDGGEKITINGRPAPPPDAAAGGYSGEYRIVVSYN